MGVGVLFLMRFIDHSNGLRWAVGIWVFKKIKVSTDSLEMSKNLFELHRFLEVELFFIGIFPHLYCISFSKSSIRFLGLSNRNIC